ncbi:unnamed protein product [Prunus armeniaca]|uniref:Uncharacterized protein n=1 Tax=Prunus armeniaca TaxID=36596 RepID=A0A6J5WE39_PRUAR|nr:unnamed protein product [Prunus armeniaca]
MSTEEKRKLGVALTILSLEDLNKALDIRYFLMPLRLFLMKLWTIGCGFFKGYRMSCWAFLGFFCY